MEIDAIYAIGTVLNALGGLLERKGVCTAQELAETLGDVAIKASEEGGDFPGQSRYLGVSAYMARVAAQEAQGGSKH